MNRYALCIGINDYPGTDSDLGGCLNDARDYGKLLESRGFQVEYLLNNDATRLNMLGKMEQLFWRDGYRVMTYSGHGSYVPDVNGDEPDGVDECLCPWDIMENGPVLDDEISKILSICPHPGPRVLISDSCHSGTLSRAIVRVEPGYAALDGQAMKRVRFLAPSVFSAQRVTARLERLCRGSHSAKTKVLDGGLVLMAGCQDYQYSYDAVFGRRQNGAFTHAAVKTFKPGMTFNAWFRAIRKRLPSPDYPQIPNLVGPRAMCRAKAFE